MGRFWFARGNEREGVAGAPSFSPLSPPPFISFGIALLPRDGGFGRPARSQPCRPWSRQARELNSAVIVAARPHKITLHLSLSLSLSPFLSLSISLSLALN